MSEQRWMKWLRLGMFKMMDRKLILLKTEYIFKLQKMARKTKKLFLLLWSLSYHSKHISTWSYINFLCITEDVLCNIKHPSVPLHHKWRLKIYCRCTISEDHGFKLWAVKKWKQKLTFFIRTCQNRGGRFWRAAN